MVTLLNYTLTIRQSDQIEQIELNDDESYLAALQQYFGIELDAQYQQLMPINSDK
ncbi:arylamine N-acetyltransferase [Vibrio brasiliensis]|uniref:arylamine N-acetyltransferase n=1 Tax=Vibrio brasiliensis TaxID=170652 RepID=UPI003CE459A8